MTELSEKCLNLEVAGDLFNDIKYFITGEVHEKVESLLKSGGAEHQNYFSDYVTHLIVGNNPEENDIADANDVYEIPAVTPKWILMCASLERRLDPNPYLFITETRLFTGQIFCFSQIQEDMEALWGLITFNGGQVHLKLTNKCTFLVTGSIEGSKYEKAQCLGPERIKIVTPDWVVQAVQVKAWPDPILYHPQLINWPKPEKPTEPTTSITGFEPDNSVQKAEDKPVLDSKQSLLESLKQRMPWNQPPSPAVCTPSSSSDPVAPPNVVAPSFLSKMQQANSRDQQFKAPMPHNMAQGPPMSPVGNQSPNHIPRSIIHHTPNSNQPGPPPTSQQNNPLSINRLIAQQAANRQPTSLQQLRGQLNTSQIHQQLLQQRIQTHQNIIHRGQNVNQHLLQQLNQGQRHTLQNQMLSQQSNLMSQINQNQQSIDQENLVSQGNSVFNQASPLTSQAVQPNEPTLQRNQLERSPSHNQVMSSPNQVMNSPNQVMNSPNQIMNSPNQVMSSPQHTHSQIISPQLQNQLLNQQLSPINQQNQLLQNNPLLNQQLSQQPAQALQQDRANQLISQQQQMSQQPAQALQQDRTNQLISQQQQMSQQPAQALQQDRTNQLLSQQQQNQMMQQQQQNQATQQLLNSQQAQNKLQNQLLGQQSPQNQQLMQQNQQMIQQQQNMLQQNQNQIMQNQASQQILQQNQQMMQQNQHIIQNDQLTQQNQHISQQSQQQMTPPNQIRQNQLLNQQNQQILNQGGQQQILNQGGQQQLLGLPSNHHLSQLSPQQLQQLQQLKREQQQLLNQTQSQMGGLGQQNLGISQQNLGLSQQNVVQNQNPQLVTQNQQVINQNQQIHMGQQNQLLQNRVLQQQQLNSQGQTFNQQLNQHILNQKQLMFNQQQNNTSQHQQLLQSQQNLTSPPQFVNQNQFEAIQQQQKLNQSQQNPMNQLSVQALNQQLQQQNLGQQLNQQLMQQNQQTQPSLGLEQNLGIIGQQGGILNQQQPQQQGGLTQQISTGMGQQVIRSPQFQQQVLVNQGQQQSGPPRTQLSQQIWVQQQQQQQGGQIPGQQIIRHPVNVAVQQNPTAGAVGPRIQWPAGQQPQRQLIHLDAHTHNQLQKLPPEQQALFVAKLQQKQRQIQLAKQVQQRAGGHILIRGNVPQGLTPQQQVQWLQQQAKQQGIVLPPNIQQSITQGSVTPQQVPTSAAAVPSQHAPGLSPINQPNAAATPQPQQQQPFAAAGESTTAQQLQLRQYRLQQLQLQREQAQKNALAQQGGLTQQAVIRTPLAGQPVAADSTTNPQVQVNPKTKTALANMLSIKLQSGGTTIGAPVRPDSIPPEPSAAGTLRMMTAQHNAAINSKPQEIIALQQQQQQQQQQRRVITGPNGEILKAAGGAATLPLTPQADPPKLQFNSKTAAVPVQHRVGPFYGHNPNLKLPPDLFLLGCIFVVVEVEDFLDEKHPGWQQKIEKYGGEVEKQYCSKVTHVLCETQRHGVVMQALRDLKRCVTIRWLDDVMKKKQVLPPWTALHLPQIYLDISPASKHLISVSGFEGNLRKIVKQMIKYTGAKFTTYFSNHNTLLICAKGDGKKVNHAKKWNIPVVNVQWLTDIILGNFSALNQMDNQTYQTYASPPNFSFDPKLVPNVMHAWKAPINISQESYERVKRSASPVSLPKSKKLKTEHTDENENITEEEVTNPDYKILFSQFEPKRLKEFEKIARDLGGSVSKDHKDFTHLVIPKLIRSHKLLFAIAKSSHILPEKWLEDSLSSNRFLPEAEYSLPTHEFNSNFNITFEQVMCKPEKHKLFENKWFWITPSVIPNKKIVCELIELCGGKIERIRRSRAQIEASCAATPNTYFIVTAKEDLHLVADLLKQKNKDKQKVVCNVELVLSAILKQEFEVEPYAVTVV